MTKVRLTCDWCNDKELYERFKRVYLSELNKCNDIQYTYEDNFDLLVIINKAKNTYSHSIEKTLGVIMEPSWINKIHGYDLFLYNNCRYVLNFSKSSFNNSIYYPGLLPYHMDYSGGDNLDFYINNKYNKIKKCSIIVSFNKQNGPQECLYNKRIEFVQKILNSDLPIDIYGNGWESLRSNDKRIKGTLENKKYGLMDYEFSIAIENSTELDYFTEKLTDCILTDTTPIYYGCPNINRFFNNVYQLQHLNDLDDLRKILKLNALDQSKNKSLMATKYNLHVAINKYVKEVIK